jgi:hypothetical protein
MNDIPAGLTVLFETAILKSFRKNLGRASMKMGLQACLIVAFCLGTAMSADSQWPLGKELAQTPPRAADSASGITLTGRYQMFVSPNAKGHTFMIDTDTGRLWVMRKDPASGDYSLHRIPVEQVDEHKQGTAPKDPPKSEKPKP